MKQNSGIEVYTTELIQDGTLIMDKAEDYKSATTSLFGTISTLLTNWTGEASIKYGDAFGAKQPKVKELGEVVSSIGLALNQGGASFQATEEQLVNMMNSMKNS